MFYINQTNLATSDSSASGGPAIVGPGGICVPNETVIDICEGTGICYLCGRYITGEEIGNRCLSIRVLFEFARAICLMS